MPTLLLVDDHPVVHVALEAALTRAIQPYRLHCAADERQALALLAEYHIDLLILDISLPQLDGLQFLRKIRRHYPQQSIIIYTAQEEEVYAKLAYTAGAQGFMHKGQPMEQLLQAIDEVLAGQRIFPTGCINSGSTHHTGEYNLTQKELQILGLLAKGHSNLHIAQLLNISNKTVSTHKTHILNKTGATNLLELIAVFNELQP
ncbi:putative two-component response regulator [Yersinia aldovae]|uniref:response regulator transcription factor n=1 Tax=Yersinia aldovae TaxID=29483 RepID=UPI0005E0B90F|nr:response regulator transcription factor [Yersinia aldovae]CNJ21204.1 putative two-component response regulator [Yersinia aldovae]